MAVTAAAALVLPVTPVAASGSGRGWAIYGAHNGSAKVLLTAGGSWRLSMLRPSTGLVVVELLALDRADYSYSEIAFPSGEADASWFDGNGGGFASSQVAGPPPRWVNSGPVRLKAGRYLVTLLTSRPTKIVLAPASGGTRLQQLAASGRTDADVSSRSLTNPSRLDAARQALDFNVPAGAHQVWLIGTAQWDGTDTVDYDDLCYSAGIEKEVPCAGDPEFTATHALNPGSPTTRWTESEMSVERPTTTGAGTASFYLVVTGTVTKLTVTAVGLP